MDLSCTMWLNDWMCVGCDRYQSITDLVRSWYDERQHFSYPNRCSGPVCSHYTQVGRISPLDWVRGSIWIQRDLSETPCSQLMMSKLMGFSLWIRVSTSALCFLSDGVGEHQQSGMCCQEVLQHVRVWEHLEGGNAAGLQLLYKVRRTSRNSLTFGEKHFLARI